MNKRYLRNYLVEGIDIIGQEKILNSTAIIFGLGGLGSHLSYHLVAMGFGHVILIDDDTVSLTNLQRQILYKESSVSKNKVDEAKIQLSQLNSEIKITILNTRNIKEVLSNNNADIIFDCTDSYKSRLHINKEAKLKNIPVCSASAVNWEGWVCMFDHINPNFSFLNVFDEKENYKTCDDQGILSPVVGMVASMQALEGIRFILKLNYAKNTLILVNSYLNEIKKISFER